MGHKKKTPAHRGRPSDAGPDAGAAAIDDDRGNLAPSEDMPPAAAVANDAIKLECERALTALRRGNHTKALRLMKESLARQSGSALLHRVHGTISVKVASLIDDPAAKQRHLRNAVESARKAVTLAPNSIEFAHFYANLLFDAANGSDGKGYEEVIQECERALSIAEPIDPAKESLQDESQQKVPTPEARIAHVQQELRNLIQKSNIASISTWMKNLGNGAGEEKFRLIPMRRLSEDPMEVRLVPTRRPNEIKKATRRRKSGGRRSRSQKPDSPQQSGEEKPPELGPGTHHRTGERRKLNNLRKASSSSDRMDQVRGYWNSMSIEKKRSLLEVNVQSLQAHWMSAKDGSAIDLLSEAMSFAESKKTWKFWLCCRCSEKFTDSDSHIQHVVREHMGSLSSKLQLVLPQEVDNDWVEMLLNGCWKPVDAIAAIKMLEERSKCDDLMPIDSNVENNLNESNEECFSENWISKGSWEVEVMDVQSSKVGEPCNGGGDCNGIADFDTKMHDNEQLAKAHPISTRWPLSDDQERTKVLERIRGMFQLLLKHKCLAAGHLNKVIQYAMDELQSLASGLHVLNHGLDQSPICICFLGASQLRKVLKFLQELSHSCGLSRYSEKNASADDPHSVVPGAEIFEKITLSSSSSCLILDERLLRGRIVSVGSDDAEECDQMTETVSNDHEDGGMDGDALLSWIFAGPSSGEKLVSWTRQREERTNQGLEILQMLEKEFYLLQSLCERKCEHLSYEEALQAVENLCIEELKRRDQAVKFVNRSYEAVLRKRQEELVERENDIAFINSRFELDAISNVLKDAQALNVSQFGYDETLSGVTPRLCDLECGDEEDWKMQDYLHQADTCIEVAIQRQKEQLSVEVFLEVSLTSSVMQLSKIDAKIMHNVAGMQQLELKLGPVSTFDYRAIILCLIKSFLRAHLEDLVEKDATEKSDAAREAFLAELALDTKKNASRSGDHSKLMPDKSKEKKRNKDYKKLKDSKVCMTEGPKGIFRLAFTTIQLIPMEYVTMFIVKDQSSDTDIGLFEKENARAAPFAEFFPYILGKGNRNCVEHATVNTWILPFTADGNWRESALAVTVNSDELKQQEEEFRRKIELEAEERKLEETLEYQRRIENEAKQKHLAEQNKKASGICLENIVEGLHVDSKSNGDYIIALAQLTPGEHMDLPSDVTKSSIMVVPIFLKLFFATDNLSNELDQSRSVHDILLNSETDGVPICHHDKFCGSSTDEAPTSVNNMPKETAVPGKSSTSASTQRTKRTSSHKSKQGLLNRGNVNDVLPSERKTSKQASCQVINKLLDGNSQALGSGKENYDTSHLPIEGGFKEQAHAQEQETFQGDNRDNGMKTLRQLHAEEEDEERFQADLQKAVRQSLVLGSTLIKLVL
ncbi:hypothetical protein ACLOJK_021010 [Asimina triloba]